MKHVKEFINEKSEDYIDILNIDKKDQIVNILNKFSKVLADDGWHLHVVGIREEDFDELAEEISKLFI